MKLIIKSINISLNFNNSFFSFVIISSTIFLSIAFYGSAAVSGVVDDLETLYESQTGRVCRGTQGAESHAGGEGAAGRKGKHGKGG